MFCDTVILGRLRDNTYAYHHCDGKCPDDSFDIYTVLLERKIIQKRLILFSDRKKIIIISRRLYDQQNFALTFIQELKTILEKNRRKIFLIYHLGDKIRITISQNNPKFNFSIKKLLQTYQQGYIIEEYALIN